MTTSKHRFNVAAVVLSLLTVAPVTFGQKGKTTLPDDVEVISDVEFGTGGGRPLRLNIVRPKAAPAAPMPAIVYIPGGGWQGGNRSGGAERVAHLAQRGFFCVSIEHRGTAEVIFPAQIEDAKCAVRFLRSKASEYHLDPAYIGAWGGSSGGHLVTLLGTSGDVAKFEGTGGHAAFSSRVQAVCNWFGPSDFVLMLQTSNANGLDKVGKLLGGTLPEVKDRAIAASPITYITKDDPPFLIMHGENDPTVPVNQSERFHAALGRHGIASSFHIVKNAGHGFRGAEHDKRVAEFFEARLKPGVRGRSQSE